MQVKRVGFVGIRTGSPKGSVSLFRDVLGLQVLREDPVWSIFQLPTGSHDLLEVYGPDFDDKRLAPQREGLFVGFTVDDVAAAHDEAGSAGLDIGDVVWAADAFEDPTLAGYGWFFLRMPDGNVFVIQQTPD